MNDYEDLRLKNIAENKKFLAELGFNPYKPIGRVVKTAPSHVKRKRVSSPKKEVVKIRKIEDDNGRDRSGRRRSSRIKGMKAPNEDEINESITYSDDEENARPPRVKPNRPNIYGLVEGVEVGTHWDTRMECCHAGIHRPPVSGIHGGAEGAYSIALSGGYEDNIDLGDCFTYTGEGGRDLHGTKSNPKNLRTAPQSKDQTLTRGNLALHTSVSTGNPVRVIRGYKLDSAFAPQYGYRYDGLYRVEKSWFTTGVSGYGVWKFALKRLSDQASPPWTVIDEMRPEIGERQAQDTEEQESVEKSQSVEKPREEDGQQNNNDDKFVSNEMLENNEKPEIEEKSQNYEKSQHIVKLKDNEKPHGDNKPEGGEKLQNNEKSENIFQLEDSEKTVSDDKPESDERSQNNEKSENSVQLEDIAKPQSHDKPEGDEKSQNNKKSENAAQLEDIEKPQSDDKPESDDTSQNSEKLEDKEKLEKGDVPSSQDSGVVLEQ